MDHPELYLPLKMEDGREDFDPDGWFVSVFA